MEKELTNILAGYIKPREKLVVAVSGGVDSVVLLDLLTKILPKESLIIAHINHGLRKESGWEEEFVHSLAKKYELPFYLARLSLKKESEEEARRERYAFLREVKAETGAKHVVTAHHLNDQAETILFNLTRGVGPIEFWGMKTVEGDVLRPLLSYKKEDLINYAKVHKLKWVEDRTNKDPKFSRNLIRLRVIPELQNINPGFLDVLKNEVMLGQAAGAELEGLAKKAQTKARTGNTIRIKELNTLPSFIQGAVIYKMIKEMAGEREISYKNIWSVFDILNKPGNKRTELAGFTISKNYDTIVFGDGEKKAKQSQKLNIGQTTDFNGFKLKASLGTGKAGQNNVLLPGIFAYNLRVRTWQAGDRIKTKAGTKKLQDVFSDAKIAEVDRKIWPVIVQNSKIVWVPKLVASKEALGASKEKVLKIEVK